MPRQLMICGRMRTIRKRKDGRWELRFEHKGIRHYVYDLNQEKCIQKFKEAYKDKDKLKKPNLKKELSLNEWIETWYFTYKVKALKQSSLESILYCKKRITPTIGVMQLSKITSLDIQFFLNGIEGSRQRQITKNHLSNIFKYAIKNNLIKDNPMLAVEAKHKYKQKEVLSPEQQQQLLCAIENKKFKLLITLYLATGIRRSEALSIRKQDIDPQRNSIRIFGTKTKNSERLVPVSSKLAAELLNVDCKEYLFEYRDEYISKTFKAACEKAGLKNFTVHSLRHSFATNCLRSGVPMKIVQAVLGHASINITSDLYTHLTQDIAFKEFTKITTIFDPTFDPTFNDN